MGINMGTVIEGVGCHLNRSQNERKAGKRKVTE